MIVMDGIRWLCVAFVKIEYVIRCTLPAGDLELMRDSQVGRVQGKDEVEFLF